MSEIINLNKARKRKARETAERQAAENRLRFGRSKAERARDAALAAAGVQRLEALRRDPAAPPAEPEPAE